MTAKQKLFVNSYLSNGFNATQAAISAGYSKRTASSQAERLLRNVEIKNAIDEKLKQIESDKIAKAQEILEFLTSVLRGEIVESIPAQIGTGKGFFHAELLDKPPSIKDRLKAAEILAKINGLFKEKTEPKTDAAQILIDTLQNVWKENNF